MNTYKIKTSTVINSWYIVKAENKEEARELLLSGDVDQPDDEDCDIHSVDVDSIEEVTEE